MTLPTESYDPKALQDIEDAVATARRIIANKNNIANSGQVPNSSPGLADIAIQAGEIAEQKQKEIEATKEALQAKIQTMAEQVFSGHNDSPEKDQNIANFSNQFRIEPKDDNPDELVIYYYDQDGTRASILNLDGRHITGGELSIPSELQITGLWCHYNQLTSLPELPAGLTRLICDNNQLTSLPELPAGLSGLWCHGNPLSDTTKKYIESRGFSI